MNYRPTMSVYNMRHAVKPVLCKLRVNHPQQHRRSVLVIDDGNVFAGVTAVHGDANKNRYTLSLHVAVHHFVKGGDTATDDITFSSSRPLSISTWWEVPVPLREFTGSPAL